MEVNIILKGYCVVYGANRYFGNAGFHGVHIIA